MLTVLTCLLACGDKPIDDGDDGQDDTGTDGGTAVDGGTVTDGGTEIEGFVPSSFTIFGSFGIDRDAGTLHAFEVDGSVVEPWIALYVVDEAGLYGCTAYFVMESPELVLLQPWSFTDATDDQAMQHLGFMLPDDVTVQTSEGCADWQDDVYGAVEDVLLPHVWGVGVGNLRDDVAEALGDADYDDSWLGERRDAGQIFGASWSADLWEPSTWASHGAVGGPAKDWVLPVDADGRMLDFFEEADLAETGGLPPTGVYLLQPVWLWSFETYFLE